MKRVGKPVFFVVAILIFAMTYAAFFGVYNYFGDTKNVIFKGTSDIRWGIDIQGGVEAVFAPEGDKSKITPTQMKNAETVLNLRLIGQNITDFETYVDASQKQIIVRFPWQAGESEFDPSSAVKELGEMAILTFCEGETKDTVLMQGAQDVKNAKANPSQDNTGKYEVSLSLTPSGTQKFSAATSRLVGKTISIFMDDQNISTATVQTPITDGNARITGNFTLEYAEDLATKINAGALPFKLSVDDSALKVIDPTFGARALEIMLLAGIISFGVVCIFMILVYRLPGTVACIALVGQVGGMLACVSGFFTVFNSFTLTIPGIAGIILSIGMGVDANVITSERIKEELRAGKTLDGAIDAGYEGGFSAIFDGNITVVIVSLLLMGAFGPPDQFPGNFVSPILRLFFKSSVTGDIYSFGFTLLTGVIFNFIMGVYASRWMTKSLSRFSIFRKNFLYGGAKNV